jgi:hypothetical protein
MMPDGEYEFEGNYVTEFPMQDGGTIYTSNLNDPRLTNYNDSLTLHNTFKGDVDKLRNSSDKEWWDYTNKFSKSSANKKALGAYKRLKKNDPSYTHSKSLDRTMAAAREYPKPTQPIKYKSDMKKVLPKKPHAFHDPKLASISHLPMAKLPPQPVLTGYIQQWDPETESYNQEPQFQQVPVADPNRYRQYGGDIQTGGGYNRNEVSSFQSGGEFQEVELTDEEIAAYRAQGIRVDVL